MEQLPIFANVRGRKVLLVGDGDAADAKRRLIESAGGIVVDAPTPDVRLAFVAQAGSAAVATARTLSAAGLMVNVVDRPDLCDFTVPSIVDRTPVTIAVGTGGASASLAKALRERLEMLLPGQLGALASAIRAARDQVAARMTGVPARRAFWDRALAPGGLLDPLSPHDNPAARIKAALADVPPGTDRFATIMLTSTDPDDLTLRQLRLLQQADQIFHQTSVPPTVLDRARRDAARVIADKAPAPPPPGIVLFVGLA